MVHAGILTITLRAAGVVCLVQAILRSQWVGWVTQWDLSAPGWFWQPAAVAWYAACGAILFFAAEGLARAVCGVRARGAPLTGRWRYWDRMMRTLVLAYSLVYFVPLYVFGMVRQFPFVREFATEHSIGWLYAPDMAMATVQLVLLLGLTWSVLRLPGRRSAAADERPAATSSGA